MMSARSRKTDIPVLGGWISSVFSTEETEDAMNIVLKQGEQWAENQDIA